MLWFKSCRRCHGDLAENSDMYGPFISCLQCGYYLEEGEQNALGGGPVRAAAPAPARKAERRQQGPAKTRRARMPQAA